MIFLFALVVLVFVVPAGVEYLARPEENIVIQGKKEVALVEAEAKVYIEGVHLRVAEFVGHLVLRVEDLRPGLSGASLSLGQPSLERMIQFYVLSFVIWILTKLFSLERQKGT